MVKQFTVNHFAENAFVVWEDKSKQCAIVDFGAKNQVEKQKVYQYIEDNELKVKYLLLTHAHVDHFCGFKDACQKYNLPLTMSDKAKEVIRLSCSQAEAMGFGKVDMEGVDFNFIKAGSEIVLEDDYIIKTLETSGHCPGSLAYYSKQDNIVFVGDAIFNLSIGRTDLYGGDLDELVSNVKRNILSLPLDTVIACGHGPLTDVEYERSNNPYVQ